MHKVLVCGGRDYADQAAVDRVLDAMHADDRIGCVVSGGARGADLLAENWANRHHVAVMRFPAPWGFLGQAAGKVRNLWMLEFGLPDRVVAFPGGAGTADMVKKARRAKVPVEVVR